LGAPGSATLAAGYKWTTAGGGGKERMEGNEPCTPQHKLMVCQFFLKEKEKGKKAIFVSKCKTWKLKVEETQNHRDQIERKCGY